MILVDANILIYAYNPSADRHAAAKRWLEAAVGGTVPVRLAWVTVLAFVRIMTHPQVFRRPLSLQEAVGIVDEWLEHPMVSVLDAGDRHWSILRGLILDGQASGPLSTDAHLAALAIEHGATLHTTDRDFARFPALKVVDPL
ncbi:MAG: TA system VapC family ribonuclease toxin [Rhodospirillaceae bacterium]